MLHELHHVTFLSFSEEHGGPVSLENALQILYIAFKATNLVIDNSFPKDIQHVYFQGGG